MATRKIQLTARQEQDLKAEADRLGKAPWDVLQGIVDAGLIEAVNAEAWHHVEAKANAVP